MRWEAKPAPPSVLISRFPEKVAVREEGEQIRVETEEPPRTRSSEVVQSEGFQALNGTKVSDGAVRLLIGLLRPYREPPKRGRCEGAIVLVLS